VSVARCERPISWSPNVVKNGTLVRERTWAHRCSICSVQVCRVPGLVPALLALPGRDTYREGPVDF